MLDYIYSRLYTCIFYILYFRFYINILCSIFLISIFCDRYIVIITILIFLYVNSNIFNFWVSFDWLDFFFLIMDHIFLIPGNFWLVARHYKCSLLSARYFCIYMNILELCGNPSPQWILNCIVQYGSHKSQMCTEYLKFE